MRRVLVVDDNRDAADTLAALVALEGHEVQVAYDGARAIEMARDCAYDAAIVEVDLPIVNGFLVARWLKALMPSISLFAMMRSPLESPPEMRRAGFSCALMKPFMSQDFLQLLAPSPKEPRGDCAG